MKQLWKVSIPIRFIANRNLSAPFTFFLAKTSSYDLFSHGLHTQQHSSSLPPPSLSFLKFSDLIELFSKKPSNHDLLMRISMQRKITQVQHKLIQNAEDFGMIMKNLEDNADLLLRKHAGGIAFVELLKQLSSEPRLALEVFNWRRRQAGSFPLTSEEYAKGISLAGRSKNVELAIELFTEASNRRIKTTSACNALMGAYMFNGLADNCHSLFQDLKREANFVPTIVTFNILLSIFGRLMLVDQMEATMREIYDLDLSPNVNTYNILLSGYVTAWMWDEMEQTFSKMKASSVKPNTRTFSLMLRGYAHSCNLQKMEEINDWLKVLASGKDFYLIRAMICAYYRSTIADKLNKIEALLKLLPEEEYRPWLNVLLIKVYAQEDWLEAMENLLNVAFEHGTIVRIHVIRSIIACYFRCNALDKLTNFVTRAECFGWRICRSLYHCKMVMYSSQKRYEEMECVLDEMKNMNLDWTKKTFWILLKAYSTSGCRCKVDQVVCYMCKTGYGIPLDSCPS